MFAKVFLIIVNLCLLTAVGVAAMLFKFFLRFVLMYLYVKRIEDDNRINDLEEDSRVK